MSQDLLQSDKDSEYSDYVDSQKNIQYKTHSSMGTPSMKLRNRRKDVGHEMKTIQNVKVSARTLRFEKRRAKASEISSDDSQQNRITTKNMKSDIEQDESVTLKSKFKTRYLKDFEEVDNRGRKINQENLINNKDNENIHYETKSNYSLRNHNKTIDKTFENINKNINIKTRNSERLALTKPQIMSSSQSSLRTTRYQNRVDNVSNQDK